MDSDVAAIEVEGRVTFTFYGKPRIGQRTAINSKLAMADAGFEQSYDFTLEVRTSQFIAPELPPNNLAIIEIDDVKYQIVGVVPDQFGVVNHYAVKQDT